MSPTNSSSRKETQAQSGNSKDWAGVVAARKPLTVELLLSHTNGSIPPSVGVLKMRRFGLDIVPSAINGLTKVAEFVKARKSKKKS